MMPTETAFESHCDIVLPMTPWSRRAQLGPVWTPGASSSVRKKRQISKQWLPVPFYFLSIHLSCMLEY